MNVLITGGCGFIGSNLAKHLVKLGWTVDVVDNMSGGDIQSLVGEKIRHLPNGSFLPHFYQSIKEKNIARNQEEILVIPDDLISDGVLLSIKNKQYDIVFHQAAVPRVSYSVENPGETTYENISKTVTLFEACADNVDRVVWASSSSVYGGALNLPTVEEERGKIIPKSPYAWQKFAVEDYAKICADLYDLDIVCLRYFNVFGPGQLGDSPYATAVSAWCYATKNGLALRSDGDGEQTRDMCYIDNVVQANILAATASRPEGFRGRCYNIACGGSVSNNEILELFSKRFDITIKHAHERPGDVKHTLADISRATSELGYDPKVLFWEGLNRTLEWWGLE